MSIAFGMHNLVITDRFVGNEDVALTLPKPKSILFDKVVVAFVGSMALPNAIRQINKQHIFSNALAAGEAIVENLDIDKEQDYSLLIADGYRLWEVDNQKGLYEMEYSAIGAGYQYVLGAYWVSKDPIISMNAGVQFSPMASQPLDIWTYSNNQWLLGSKKFV